MVGTGVRWPAGHWVDSFGHKLLKHDYFIVLLQIVMQLQCEARYEHPQSIVLILFGVVVKLFQLRHKTAYLGML